MNHDYVEAEKCKRIFVNQMKDISSLGNKSITVSKQDFDKLIEYAENKFDNRRIRDIVIGQSGYGLDGCKLCGSTWMRRPYTELTEHTKECLAYPLNNSLRSPSPVSDKKEV